MTVVDGGPPAPGEVDTEPGGPPWPLRSTPSRLSAVVWGGGLALICVLAEVFLVPLRAFGVPVPLSVVAAVVVTPLLVRWTFRTTGSILMAGVPSVVWMLVAVPMSTERPEGDVAIPGTVSGTAFLVLGILAAVLSWAAMWAANAGRTAWKDG